MELNFSFLFEKYVRASMRKSAIRIRKLVDRLKCFFGKNKIIISNISITKLSIVAGWFHSLYTVEPRVIYTGNSLKYDLLLLFQMYTPYIYLSSTGKRDRRCVAVRRVYFSVFFFFWGGGVMGGSVCERHTCNPTRISGQKRRLDNDGQRQQR